MHENTYICSSYIINGKQMKKYIICLFLKGYSMHFNSHISIKSCTEEADIRRGKEKSLNKLLNYTFCMYLCHCGAYKYWMIGSYICEPQHKATGHTNKKKRHLFKDIKKQSCPWRLLGLINIHNFCRCHDSFVDIVWQWQGALMWKS